MISKKFLSSMPCLAKCILRDYLDKDKSLLNILAENDDFDNQ